MGMYLSAVKKEGDNFTNDNRFDDSKWVDRWEFFCIMRDCSESPSEYVRPNIELAREKLKNSELNNKDVFNGLLDLMEKDENVYAVYE